MHLLQLNTQCSTHYLTIVNDQRYGQTDADLVMFMCQSNLEKQISVFAPQFLSHPVIEI